MLLLAHAAHTLGYVALGVQALIAVAFIGWCGRIVWRRRRHG